MSPKAPSRNADIQFQIGPILSDHDGEQSHHVSSSNPGAREAKKKKKELKLAMEEISYEAGKLTKYITTDYFAYLCGEPKNKVIT